LKDKRTSVRFSEKVKTYLNKICLTCEKTGKRPDYVTLADEIRNYVMNRENEFLRKQSG